MTSEHESLFAGENDRASLGPVECLGITFSSDEERRNHFTALLRERLGDSAFRAIDGFPIGEDDDILALSDPPYYTACPNPWVRDFVAYYGDSFDAETDAYQREPFAADVSEGRNDPIYNAHSYHTKVPHKAIMRYILHYTDPGDVVFDGFCGTGMTGVAALLCGDRAAVKSLGFAVGPDATIRTADGKVFSRLGARHAVLTDLSPAATFISQNYNCPPATAVFKREAERILGELEGRYSGLYLTLHEPSDAQLREALDLLDEAGPSAADRAPNLPWARVNYVVWSDAFTCPHCGGEFIFWDVAINEEDGTVRTVFPCPSCHVELRRGDLTHAYHTKFDRPLGRTVSHAGEAPVQVNYTFAGRRFDKPPDAFDVRLAETAGSESGFWFPTDELPVGFNTEQPKRSHGYTHLHHFFTDRNRSVLAGLYALSRDSEVAGAMLCLLGDQLPRASRMHKIAVSRLGTSLSKTAGVLAGTLYIPSNRIEYSVLEMIRYRIDDTLRAVRASQWSARNAVSCCSSTFSQLPNDSVDYIFVDPPFGANLMYSELNLGFEGWLRVRTANDQEAIENSAQGKNLAKYESLMSECFNQFGRALKPGRWISVEFHNSKNSVWRAIQEALQRAGFVVADVRTLDKKHKTVKQVTGAGAVKQDLVISAYRPRTDVEREFSLKAGAPDGAWAFVRGHLRQLPVSVEQDSTLETVAERQSYLLYDRMVAFHVLRGVRVPLSAAEFYAGLDERFACRDGMYFLSDQVAEYDKKRMQAHEVVQLELFVTDEESAIQWLRRILLDRPMSFQDVHPLFMREIAGWEKYEKPLELAELLEENFICYDGAGDVPSQIHAYLSSNFREMRGLDKDDSALRAKAKDRWFVPDPRKAGDLEQLRERTLLREFDDYAAGKGKLKLLRLEAVRAGFKRAWQEHDYGIIIAVSERLPADVLQEDAKLLMWYDQALTRAGE